MIIEGITLKGFGPVKHMSESFRHENCIIGLNGSGKTMLLSVLAGVGGTDRASLLIQDQPVEHCEVAFRDGSDRFSFEAKGKFDAENLREFKKRLPKRVNFALTEWAETFPSNCVDVATAKRRLAEYTQAHRGHLHTKDSYLSDYVYSPASRSARFIGGDGYAFVMSLFLNDSSAGTPVLFDNPSRHMDLRGKRIMTEMLCRDDRQLFYTTHCPEMVLHDAWKGNNKEQYIIDMSPKP